MFNYLHQNKRFRQHQTIKFSFRHAIMRLSAMGHGSDRVAKSRQGPIFATSCPSLRQHGQNRRLQRSVGVRAENRSFVRNCSVRLGEYLTNPSSVQSRHRSHFVASAQAANDERERWKATVSRQRRQALALRPGRAEDIFARIVADLPVLVAIARKPVNMTRLREGRCFDRSEQNGNNDCGLRDQT